MCITPKAPKLPPLPAPPLRSSEEVQQGELAAIDLAKKRKSKSAVFLTGGLGTDGGFGSSVVAPTVTGG